MNAVFLFGIGVGSDVMFAALGIYLIILIYSLYYILQRKDSDVLKIARCALALLLPVLGLILIWGEVFFDKVLFAGKRPVR